MVCDWPGYYSLYRDPKISAISDRVALTPYPPGPSGRSLVYGGGHTFALTRSGIDNPEALDLLLFLTDYEQQMLEARNGCVPVRRTTMKQMQIEADDENKARLAMLDKVIAEQILIPPKFAKYPEVEEVLWRTVQNAITGQINVDHALCYIREQIEQIVRSQNGSFVQMNGKRDASWTPSSA
jgi:multiple sugar transport system substrate-binding protein